MNKNPIVRNVLAVIAGFVFGSAVNMGIISMGSYVIPPPEGADVTTMEGLKATMHLFEPRHFIMPFLAHALGTFAGALVAALIAATNKMKLALAIGVLFLLGGIAMAVSVPSPVWYMAMDLLLAYFPMAYLGGRIGDGRSQSAIRRKA